MEIGSCLIVTVLEFIILSWVMILFSRKKLKNSFNLTQPKIIAFSSKLLTQWVNTNFYFQLTYYVLTIDLTELNKFC